VSETVFLDAVFLDRSVIRLQPGTR